MSAKRHFLFVVTVVLLALTVASGDVRAQQSRTTPITPLQSGGATSVISPVVVAQWFTNRKTGVEELELLVLWRGAPGWFLQPGGAGGSFSGTGTQNYTWIKYGSVSLSLDFDAAKRIVTIQGKELVLAGNNVLFVDDVDTPSGPRVAGAIAVSRSMPGSSGQIAPVLRSSPRIMSYLQCEAGHESVSRALLDTLCLQNVGVAR